MKLKLLFAMLALFVSSIIYATDVSNLVAVSADGNETTYLLADVQRIEVQADNETGKMTILQKNGTKVGNYQKILFATSSHTSLEENKELQIFVFPNPVSHTLHFQSVDENTSLEVYNLTGKSVIKDKGTELDVTSLNQGTYILRINNQYVKFIKK
ncbi:MAG: T9SS type A sorting domain-containing protein [Paludibacteraceae bacterium]|nr:T9SS type A sorting domain-containing protein [Paludibacteraceae bacterium]MBR6686573.1 T9SS type A sorting domain-containing protein [Paludibacteraceae bacterium]